MCVLQGWSQGEGPKAWNSSVVFVPFIKKPLTDQQRKAGRSENSATQPGNWRQGGGLPVQGLLVAQEGKPVLPCYLLA